MLTGTAVLSKAFTPILFPSSLSMRKEGRDQLRAGVTGCHSQDRTPGTLCSSPGPFSTQHRAWLRPVGSTTDFDRKKSLILPLGSGNAQPVAGGGGGEGCGSRGSSALVAKADNARSPSDKPQEWHQVSEE